MTTEQHLNNVLWGLQNDKKTWKEHEAVKSSYEYLRARIKELEEKEIKNKDIITP